MRKPPYSPLVARRALCFPAAVLLGGAGCATTAGSAADIAALKEEVSTLRRERRMDEKRIEALENQFDAQQAQLSKLRHGDLSDDEVVPPLAVIHLGRRSRPMSALPPVPTSVAVREPDDADLAALDDAASRSAAGGAPAGDPDTLFQQAFEKLKTGDLVGAAIDFQTFAQNFPRNDAADNALLDEGIALYGQRRFGDALAVLTRIEGRYPAGDAVPEAIWRAADCEEQLGRAADAKKRLRHLAKDYPQTPEGARALEKLGGAAPPAPAAPQSRASGATGAGDGTEVSNRYVSLLHEGG